MVLKKLDHLQKKNSKGYEQKYAVGTDWLQTKLSEGIKIISLCML